MPAHLPLEEKIIHAPTIEALDAMVALAEPAGWSRVGEPQMVWAQVLQRVRVPGLPPKVGPGPA